MRKDLVWIDIEVPTCKARIIVAIGSEKKFAKQMKKQGAELSPIDGLARCSFLRIDDEPLCFNAVIFSKSAAISVIAHEAVHAASFIFEAMGVVPDFNNDEHFAYLVQHICQKAEEALYKD